MTRLLVLGVLCAGLVPGMAVAHVGHLGEVAGHSHWIALGAIGLAGAIAVWAGLKGKASPEEEAPDEEDQPDGAEA